MKTLFFLLFLLSFQLISAQPIRCLTDENHQHLMQVDANYAKERKRIDSHTLQYLQNPKKQRAIKTIPVVFHVVYNTPAQNISTEQILSQLAVLNNDFRKLNADVQLTPPVFQSLSADCEIQFCLAQQDPQGNPTTGIVRVPTSVTGFTNNDSVKFTSSGGSDAWNRDYYLNIWICNFSVGLLGYAQFPGGPAATDGVVCNYISCGTMGTALAPYNKGRTLTHEIAHWLNLKHIWGDDGTGCLGSDGIQDTPNQAGYNSNCPTFPKISCNNGPNGDLFMNFMDYTPDACMYMFTTGQKLVMEAQFANGGSRATLLNSPGCLPGIVVNCEQPLSLTGFAFSNESATLSWGASSFSQGYTLEYRTMADSVWTSLTTGTTTLMLTGLSAATPYECRVRSNCNGSNSNWSSVYSFTTLIAPCTPPTNLTASNISAQGVTLSWTSPPLVTHYLVQYKWLEDTSWTSLVVQNADQIALNNLNPSATYQVRIQTNCSIVNSAWSPIFQFNTLSPACSNSFETNDTKATAKTIPLNSSIASMIQVANDKDYFIFTTTTAAPKISVIMNNLPADYDIRLLASNAITSHVIAQKRGLATERITWNTPTTGATYYLYVTGYNGAFNNAACYNITLRTSAVPFREDVDNEIPSNEPTFTCYPNPAQNNLYIHCTIPANSNDTWTMYDRLGRVVKRFQDQRFEGETQFSIDVSSIANGVYLIEHLSETERSTQRILIQK